MIKKNSNKAFDIENDFYHICDVSRIGKAMAHYELYKMSHDIPGAIVECGVFKGVSLIRFAMFRELLSTSTSKKIIGFDVFSEFPKTQFIQDKLERKKFMTEAGSKSIQKNDLLKILKKKRIEKNVELIKGDITKTVPAYTKNHPELKISLLNVDVDLYEPSVTILETLFPLVSKGGIVIFDDYGIFAGETKAVDDYFNKSKVEIKKIPFSKTPSYFIKK